MEEENRDYLNMVSIRLIPDAPLLSTHQIRTPEDAIHVMGKFLSEMDREVLCVVNLKTDGTPINGHIASIGALNQTLAEPRELLKAAILSNAASMILLHCHPSGRLEPSKEDVALTDRMLRVCSMVGIPLLDHIIIGGNTYEYFSLRENALLNNPDVLLEADCRHLQFEAPRAAEGRCMEPEVDEIQNWKGKRGRYR